MTLLALLDCVLRSLTVAESLIDMRGWVEGFVLVLWWGGQNQRPPLGLLQEGGLQLLVLYHEKVMRTTDAPAVLPLTVETK